MQRSVQRGQSFKERHGVRSAMEYVVLRIKADNPGLWLLHCHILWHHGVGMAMTLQVE